MKPLLSAFSLLFFSTIVLLNGCSKHRKNPAPLPDPVLSQQYRQNNTLLILSVSETNILTSGKIQLILELHAPETEPLIVPEIEPLIAPFTVSEYYAEPAQTLPNGKLLQRRVWWLVPKLPGKSIFQSFDIQVGTTPVTTDPITVRVTSLLPHGLDTFEIKDIAEEIPRTPAQKNKQALYSILALLVASTGLTIGLIKWGRRPKKTIALSLHEAAARAFENLPSDPASRLQEIRRILLVFMEGYFHLSTEGKTTDQIIPLLPESPLLDRRTQLVEFLTTLDLIRFSNRIPKTYPLEAERYVRSIIEEMNAEEEPCN